MSWKQKKLGSEAHNPDPESTFLSCEAWLFPDASHGAGHPCRSSSSDERSAWLLRWPHIHLGEALHLCYCKVLLAGWRLCGRLSVTWIDNVTVLLDIFSTCRSQVPIGASIIDGLKAILGGACFMQIHGEKRPVMEIPWTMPPCRSMQRRWRMATLCAWVGRLISNLVSSLISHYSLVQSDSSEWVAGFGNPA